MRTFDIGLRHESNPSRRVIIENICADNQQEAHDIALQHMANSAVWVLDHVTETIKI